MELLELKVSAVSTTSKDVQALVWRRQGAWLVNCSSFYRADYLSPFALEHSLVKEKNSRKRLYLRLLVDFHRDMRMRASLELVCPSKHSKTRPRCRVHFRPALAVLLAASTPCSRLAASLGRERTSRPKPDHYQIDPTCGHKSDNTVETQNRSLGIALYACLGQAKVPPFCARSGSEIRMTLDIIIDRTFDAKGTWLMLT